MAFEMATVATDRESGCLLLSLEQNAILSLNDSALVFWDELERRPKGMTIQQLVDAAQQHFSATVPRTLLVNDAELLSERLLKAGFVTVTGAGPQRVLRIRSDVLRSVQRDESESLDARELNELSLNTELEVSRVRRVVDNTLAFFALLSFELVKLFLGFGRLIAIVSNFPILTTSKDLVLRTRQICAGVNRVTLWYPKQIHCLQHSAVVTCLLRIQGIPATMIIGATQRPFYAHAWSEVYGNVVNDSPSVRETYGAFLRPGTSGDQS